MSLFSGILKYVWPQMRKYKIAFFTIIILFGTRVVLDNIIRPLYFKKIIDTLSITSVDRTILSVTLLKLVFITIALNFTVTSIARFCKFVLYKFEINVIKELRNLSFEKISKQSQTFFSNTFSGSLVTKSRRFVGSFESMFDIMIYNFYSSTISLLGMFFVIYSQSPRLAFYFFIFITVYILIIFFFIKKKIYYDSIEAKSDSRIGGSLADVFSNILAVKIFSTHTFEDKLFKDITKDAASKSKQAWFFAGKIEVVQGFFSAIMLSLILYIMIRQWIDGKISTGTVVLIQTYMVIVLDKLWDLSTAFMKFMKAAADMKEVIEIFDTIPDILDPENPEKLSIREGHLVFKDVSFKYENGQSVFDKFNIDIKPGERIGLVGHSGAGKSTFTNLILRFADVNSGSIIIDGQDVKSITQDDLRSVISYVPQESILFHRTIRENIAYGKPEATEKEIKEAAKKAHAHEFIERLPHGYDTLVGERGVKLSGGERQRIAIARAMIKNAPLLVLDEATSSLDSISEQYIQEAFGELMKGKTTIVIAHRLSTIQKMDRILVLENGTIVEEGNHKELLAKNGHYADLWNHQVGGFIE
jgi:ATP-binding cassette, subfamily B, bacterial